MATLNQIVRALEQAERKIATLEQQRDEPVALVGLGCRFPRGSSPDAFWRSLEAGADAVSEIPGSRWRAEPLLKQARWAGLLDDGDVAGFDAAFFGIAAREAAAIDPQQRLLLQVSVEALEDAGIPLESIRGARAGVFVGMMTLDYQQLSMEVPADRLDVHTSTGIGACFGSGRLSYSLGLEGPSISIDAACSSSLVALHLACQSLRARECDLAVAGGVNLLLSPWTMRLFVNMHALSPDGRCRTFDAQANGFVRGEGCGVVVLKRLSDAVRDGDSIRALVRGSAVNHNGRSSGLTAPSVPSQQTLVRQALAAAQVSPRDIDYVEAHGIATPLGDPIEIEALKATIGAPRSDGSSCVLGSVKPNIGHLEAAAGVAGIIKTVLALEHERIPPHLHFETLNPRISLQGTALEIAAGGRPWARGVRARRAGVSSFGLSGANAHVVLEEAPASPGAGGEGAGRAEEERPHLAVVTARSEPSLRRLAARYAEALEGASAPPIRDVAYTTTARRSHHPHRLAVVGSTAREVAASLRGWLAGAAPRCVRAGRAPAGGARIVFAYPDRPEGSELSEPAVLAIQVAMTAAWRAAGVEPDRVLGYGVGELAAAHAAGILPQDAADAASGRRTGPVQFFSTATGQRERAEALDDAHWLRAPRGPDRLRDALARALEGEGESIIVVQVCADPALAVVLAEVAAHPARRERVRVVTGPRIGEPELRALLEAVGEVFVAGGAVAFPRGPQAGARLARLPTYAWELERCWIERAGGAPAAAPSARADGAPAAEHPASPLVVQAWRPRAHDAAAPREAGVRSEAGGRWLIASAGDGDPRSALLAEHLRAAGQEVAAWSWGDGADAAAIEAALGGAFAREDGRGIVVWAGAGGAPPDDADGAAVQAAVERTCWEVWQLVQIAARWRWRRGAPRLYLITESAQRVEPEPRASGACTSLRGAALWGLGRTISLQVPELRCTRLDLEPASELAPVAAALVSEPADEELGLRGASWYAGSLERIATLQPTPRRTSRAPAGGRPFRLELHRAGILDHLTLRATHLAPPGPGQVRVRVESAGLNFMDVMTAMGIYPGAATGGPDPIVLGGECSGRIEAVGPGVASLAVGDPVVAVGRGCFGSHVTTDSAYVQRRPAALDAILAGGVPIVFLTAWYALVTLGRLQQGERVLIHSAAGGVGLAAIQIAKLRGAEIYATAGTEEKRALLRELGIATVMDSRSQAFAAEVLEATGGEGVDVVLNSLSGAAIEASLAALASDGRFLEIGKTDIYGEERALALAPFRKRLSYQAIDLLGLAQERKPRFAALFAEVMEAFEAGVLRPLPTELFPAAETAEAFRCMAQGRQAGKLVVQLEGAEVEVEAAVGPAAAAEDAEAAAPAPAITERASYLVVGGPGALGRSLTEWLVEQGARRIVWLSRRGPAGAGASAAAHAEALRSRGVELRVCAGDASRPDDVAAAVAEAEAMGPLRGVVHAAGAADDAAAQAGDRAGLGAVLTPKVAGAWNVHRATERTPLDFFVLCSSASALLGAPGRFADAAASAFLDGLARHRRSRGLPALCIQWGALAAAGDRGRSGAGGVHAIEPREGWRALHALLAAGADSAGVLRLDARQWIEYFPHLAGGTRFQALLAGGGEQRHGGDRALLDRFTRASEAERGALLEELIRQELTQILRKDPGPLDPDLPFKALGIDSLMGLELRNRLEAALGITLSAALIWAYPDLRSLGEYLLGRLVVSAAPPAKEPDVPHPRELDELEDLRRLSDDQQAALLERELTSLERMLL